MGKSDRSDYGALLREAYRSIERLQTRIGTLERVKSEPIAIVGMGCRIPGGANDPEKYWEILRNGVDAVTEIPLERWDASHYYNPDPEAVGMMCTRWGGFLENVDQFDAQFFGISPREAISMDPQQRLLLEVAWEALENAGIAPESLMGSQTGAFVGISTADYSEIQTKSGAPDVYTAYLATGNSHSVASGRLAYFFGLQGPTFSVDTACSSSLIAVHLACQALRTESCHAALACGVNLILVPEATITLSKAQMMAANGHCKTFSDDADGFVRGEGCGVVVLKRMSDAIVAGDRILAVIRGGAINQDGRSNGLTAPNGLAQVALIRSALADAQVKPAEVGYVEAHGTGTPLGDPIEIHAIAEALSEGRLPDNRLRVGSAKTNLGHLEAASGMAGLIKVVLALQTGQIPPHLHFHQPSRQISWSEIPIDIPTTLTSWNPPSGRRIAGVSSFGFSGSNAHIVLEQAPEPTPMANTVERPLHLLTLSARTAPALTALVAHFVRHFEQSGEVSLPDICFTAGTGRSHFSHRLALTAASAKEAREKLARSLSNEAAAGVHRGVNRRTEYPEIAFLFTGQGAQYAGMARGLLDGSPTFRRALERCMEALNRHLKRPLASVLYGEDAARIDETEYAQPALFAIEYALAQLWRSWGIEPTIVVGHSVGEYVAACVAGVMSLDAAAALVTARGRLMQALPPGGAMVAITAPRAEVEEAVARLGGGLVSIAAVNAPENVVLSGNKGPVDVVASALVASGARAQRLVVSHAFHSRAIEPMLDGIGEIARQIQYEKPRLAWLSTMTAEMVREPVDANYWVRQARNTVRYADAVSVLRARGIDFAVEIGPAPVLVGLARSCGVEAPGWVGSLRKGQDDWTELLSALGTLYVNGANVDWAGMDKDYARRRVALPTYPFQRQRFWYECSQPAASVPSVGHSTESAVATQSLLGKRLRSGLPEIQFETVVGRTQPQYLADHVVHGITIFPATGYAEMALSAAAKGLQWDAPVLEDVVNLEPLVLSRDGNRPLQIVVSPPRDGRAAFRILSAAAESDEWTLHATGTISETRTVSSTNSQTLGALQKACPEKLSVDGYYERLRGQGLKYGTQFRCIQELSSGDRQAIGRVAFSPSVLADAEISFVHPALLDACMQVLGATIPFDARQVGDTRTYLPIGFERIEIWKRGATELWSHAAIREAPVDADIQIADVKLFDASGRAAGQLSGLLLKRATADTLRHSVHRREVADWFYEERWEPKPPRSAAVLAGHGDRPHGVWLIVAFGDGPSIELSEALRARGERAVVVHPGETWCHNSDDSITVNLDRPEDYRRLVSEYSSNEAPLGVVMMHQANNATPIIGPDACRGAVHLAQAMGDPHGNGPLQVWLVTSGAQGFLSPQRLSLHQAPLVGLARTLAVEQPALNWVRVDLDPDAASGACAIALADELLAGDDEGEIAFRQGNRYVRRLARASLLPYDAKASRIRSDATYLITGGYGSLGLVVARWLVERGARHLVLVGRSGPRGKAVDVVTEFERKGVSVRVAHVDVADEAQMKILFADLARSMPALAGVIHAAGIVEDGLIGQLSWESFERVFASKVQGAWMLHVLTERLPLDFFVLFSSAASFFGSPGQANYAAANAFLDALARQRHALGLPAVSVSWGPWEGGGMAAGVDDVHRRRWLRWGTRTIDAKGGTSALERALACRNPGVAVVPIDWMALQSEGVTTSLQNFAASFFQETTGGTTPASKKVSRAMLLGLPEKERVHWVADYLSQTVAGILGTPQDSFDPDQALTEWGFDSLMALELKNRMERDLESVLPMAQLLNSPSVRQLARLVAGTIAPLDAGKAAEQRATLVVAAVEITEEGEL